MASIAIIVRDLVQYGATFLPSEVRNDALNSLNEIIAAEAEPEGSAAEAEATPVQPETEVT